MKQKTELINIVKAEEFYKNLEQSDRIEHLLEN